MSLYDAIQRADRLTREAKAKARAARNLALEQAARAAREQAARAANEQARAAATWQQRADIMG